MTLDERSETLQRLYRQQAELAALFETCRVCRAVSVGVFVATAQNAINEAIAEFRPEDPQPCSMEFPRAKR